MFSQIPSCLCREAGEQLPQPEPSHLAGQGDAQAVVLPAAASSSTQLQDREGEPSLGSLAALGWCQAQPEPAGLAEVPDGVLLPGSLPCSCGTLSGVFTATMKIYCKFWLPDLELPPTPSLVSPRSVWDYRERWLREHRAIRSLQDSHGYKPQRSVS